VLGIDVEPVYLRQALWAAKRWNQLDAVEAGVESDIEHRPAAEVPGTASARCRYHEFVGPA
jgi:hypothetical protein